MQSLVTAVGRDPNDDSLWWNYQSLATHQPDVPTAGVTSDDFADFYITEWRSLLLHDLRKLGLPIPL
jgi:hypothetical protein